MGGVGEVGSLAASTDCKCTCYVTHIMKVPAGHCTMLHLHHQSAKNRANVVTMIT